MTQQSRAERLERMRGRHRRVWALGVATAAAAAVLVTVALVALRQDLGPAEEDSAVTMSAPESAESTFSSSATTATVPVEVPQLVGMPIAEAELLVAAAGLLIVQVPTPAGESPEGTVLSQDPAAGERVAQGASIRLVYADTGAAAEAAVSAIAAASNVSGFVVCIDPGHQAAGNSAQEPVGPGATQTKAKVTGGAVGVVTRRPEHELVLTLGMKV
ncbi:MAG: PASTA domain-containing protein, partial [Coriobacteriia bacterium]